MFEFHNHAGKRVMAMLLVFAMMFAMLGEYAPSWVTAFAEAVSEDSGSSSSEDRSSDGHESSHSDSGSSGSHESSSHSESSSSSSHESSSSDSGSSSSHESSSSDSSSSGSHESSSSDSSSSSSQETSSSDSGSSGSHESSSSDSSSSSSQETSSSDSSSSSGNASSSSEDDSSSSQETSFSDSSASSGNASSSSEDGSSSGNEASSSDDADAEDAASEKISSDTSEKPTVSQEDSGVSPSSEDTGSENEQNGASVENVEVTSEGEGASEDSVVSETNEDSAADDSIPVFVWGSSEDGDMADQMEAETAPSEEPTPAEAEGEPTEVGTDNNAPSEESAPLEAPVEEVEALIGETDPADVEAVDSGDGTASEEITPIEGKEEQTENGIEDAEADDQGTVLTLTAALSPAAENSEPAEDEAEAAESEPVFTTQAYTAPVMLAATGTEQEKVCVLQQKINDAMGSVTGTLTGKLKVVLEKNTAYEGTVSIEKGSREVADDFQLEIEAEDAGDDGQQAEGKTTFTGTMSIKGINVAIRGIGLPGKVSVQDAALAYSGTEANDTVNVEVGSGASADIQTAAGDDKVTASAGDDGKLTLDTGAGDDTVTATGKDEAKLNIQTGEGGDNVTATIDQNATAAIDTGAGDDKVNLTDKSIGKAEIETGDDNDTVEVDVGAESGFNAGDVTVSTGDGDDSVTLTNKDGGKALDENRRGNITVDLGTGVNEATVSTDVAGIVPNVTVSGEGNDHVHLTGTLNSSTTDTERISGTKERLSIAADRGTMELALQNIESLTDDLKNKRTKTLTAEEGKKVTLTYEEAEAFTNYVLKAESSKIDKIVIRGKDGQPMLLSSLVIDTPTTWDGDNKLIIPEDAIIDAQGMNVRLTARDIEVDGTIKAGTVQLEALDGTGMYSRNFSDLYSSFSGTIPVPGLDQAGSALAAGAEMAWDLVNINDKATITIGEKGAVIASNDVIMLAKVEQNGTLISLIPLNVVNVKVAHASIDIAGKVYAGVKNIDDLNSDLSNVEFDEGHGTVRANAQIKTTIGYDEKDHMSDGWPLAVSVVYANAAVNVKKGATVEAAGDVQLGTKSEVKAATRADSGLGGLPAAVAVAVLINDAHTTVNGTVNAKGGDVKLTANGDINARTLADKGAGQKSISGGYAAVTVALQDVKAELGKTAVVNAKGQAQVLSNAVEKVENRSTSGKEKSEVEADDSVTGQIKTAIIEMVTGTILPKVVEFVGKKYFPDSAEKKLQKAIDKVSNGNHSVKLADNAQKHGDVSTAVDTMDGKTRVSVFVTPREGYKVKQVLWRGYNAGDDKYTMGEAIGSGNDFSFIQNVQNVMVFVKYEEVEAPETPEDRAEMDAFFKQYEEESEEDTSAGDEDISSLLDGLNSSINSVDDDEEDINEQLKELSDEIELVDLTRTGANGSILTLETENDDLINPLKKVYTGQKFELIPNPKDGYKLKNGGLTAMYHVTEKVDGEDVVVTKKVVINPDDQGRYYFEVPAKGQLDVKQGITIDAAFEKGEASKDADKTQLQLTGTVAVAVTDNDNRAVIAEGAQVNAGGVELSAVANTDVTNVADGTAASKEEEKKKNDDYKIKRPDSKEYAGYDVEGLKFGLLADATQNGSIKVEKADGVNVYEFVIEATPEAGYKAGTALVTYYQGGEKKTAKLEPDEDGKYHFNLAGSGLNADEGSTAVVSFGFVGTEDGDVTVSDVTTSAPQVIISNSIQIAYNALKEEKYDRIAGYAGKILYNDSKNKKDYDGNITAYAFVADPDAKKGYALDGKLTATYKDASGKEQTKELTEENGVWYLDMSGIPAGAPIKVSGKFKDDLHDFKVDEKKTVNGKVTLHDEKVKTSDKPKITVTPNAGFAVGDIVVTYKDNNTLREKTLKLSAGDLVQVKKDGKVVEGLYELKADLPEMSIGDVTVSASFNRKSIGLYAGENDKSTDYTLSEKNAAKGDKVTVTPNADKLKAGYKVTKVTVTDATGKTVAESTDGSFTVSDKTEDTAQLTVKAELGLKDIEIKNAKLDHGTVTASVARADRGEKVTLTIKPDDNFRLKSGTLKAVVTSANGNTEEVFASRQNDTTYTFDMPSDIAKDSTVSFIGDFEPGQSDSSAVETSLGAGIAVTVSNSESRADVSGEIESQGSVKVQAEITGGVKNEAKAGYSKGNIGMGGAVSVQVASMDAKALIHDTADIEMDGKLTVDSKADITYNVNADASGSKEAAKVGVGAGIAVAVNGSDVFAGVQDGASIDHRDDSEAMKGFSVTAVQKLKDEVKAKAGAAGGTAVVPVAAVDVIAAKANAYMGEAFTGKLKLTENAAVSAQTDASHTISADASASGKGAGVGGAFGVTVISDKATAKLAQSVDASQVTVAAQTIASVANTATASASGGKTGGKSPDKQADGLIGGASKLAGQNKSSGVSGNNIDKMTKDRQKGETSEGSVAVAGAVVVNVQNSTSRAEIVDGVDVKASGLLAVTALNGTTSKVKANASTTNSNVGVGVGVAVNIVGLQNIARMGNGEFEAAMLKVAANTKETTPEEKKAEASKAKDKDAAASELGEMVKNYMTDLAKEIGLDQYVPASLLGTILDPIVSDVTNSLLTSTGLDKLFGDGGLQAKYDKAIELLQGEKSALVSLPEKLIEPMMEIVTDALDLGSLTDEQYTALMEALYKEFTQKLKDNLMDTEALGLSVLDTLKGAALDWVKKEGPSLLKGMFTGNQKADTWKKATVQVAKHLGEALKVEIKRITSKSFEQALGNVKVPGLSLQNRSRAVKAFNEVKDSWKAGSLSNIFDDAVNYVTGTFKEQVFDYEQMITTVAKTNWVDKISKALRDAAASASVELGNEAISWLTSTLGVELEAEQESATGHVVDTQAISGAGTKNVGVAGSVAITVLNAETKATIGNGGRLEVSGGMTVDASELRSVKNVASAALDAKGNAKDNKASENKDNKNIGGGNDATSIAKNDKNTTNLSVGVGGTASIVESEKGQDRPKLHIKLKDGYKLPEGDKVNFTYTNKDGFEVNGTVVAKKEGDEWVIDTANDEQLKKADKDTLISLEVKPEEVLHKIVDPDASLSDQGVEKGAVTVSVKDRKVNDDNTISARAGETVEVRIAKKEGRVLNGMGYSYKDADGKVHEVELNPATGTSTGKEKAFTLVSSNEKEIIYTFTMPDGDVDALLISLVEGQEEQPSQDASTAAKDKNGASVGVGAAFSMVYGDTQTHAEVGERAGTVTAGAMNVTATSDHKENISATAGTDPMSGDLNTADSKKISLDASVALNILDTDVKAKNDANATDVRGYVDGEEEKSGDLTVTAKENAVTETTSSAFAVGGQTAVGASVAINIANSGVKAQMPGDATVDGNATVSSNSHSEDTTKALATAMGADMARVAGKIGDAAESLEEKSNKVLDGSYLDKAEDKKDNQTSNKINDRLNEKKGDSGKSAKGGAATSSNVLRSQEVKMQNGEEGSSETSGAMGEVSGQVGSTLGVNKKQEKQKVEVAAAVGLTIASHEASTEVGKIIAGKKIETTSENTGNFNTMGTGAAMSLAEKTNAIAMGVAVSVNSNKSGVRVNGDLESTDKEDVTVTSKLTQNMDGDFQGKLAAQSLAGSVSGKGGAASIAGAVSVVVSKGKSTVDIASGTEAENRSIKGGNVTVEATDKSKITARAGGLSLSTGAAMGMGIASTNIITSNGVSAKVGDYTTVEANSFKLNAEKQEVTAKDFKNLIDMRYLVTDSSKLSDAERESANTGLIDFHKGEDDKNYKVSVNLDSEKLLDAIDGLNFLSGQNTYAEAIAGSISGGASSSLAGSFAVVVTNNDVKASMGKSVKVTAASGDVDVNAKDGNTTRIIAGSLSAAPATNSTGATVAVLVNSDTVDTEVGENAELNAAGNISQTAEASGDQQVFTAAMSLASGANKHQDSDKEKEEGGSGQSTDTGASVGGAINVIVSKIHANNVLGNNAKLTAGGNADVTSKAKFDLMAISGSAGVAAGGGTAAGGTVNVIVDSTNARTNVGDNAKIEANKNLTIGSDVTDQLISGTASLSAAGSSGMTDGMAGAAVVNVIVSHSKANTTVGEAADLAATTGDMKINANNDAWMLNASLAVAGAKNLAVGGAFNVNVFGREATVDLKSGKLNAGGNLAVQTSGKDTGVMAGLTVVANSTTNGDPAVNGNIGVTVESNKIGTKIADGITATAGKNALFESYFSDYTVAAAGSITGSGGGSSLSGTVVTVVKNNDVRTELGASTIAGLNGGNSATSLSNKTVNGVYVGANAQETQYVGAAGMAAAGGSSINGEIVTLVNNNKVIADASKAKLSSYVETVTMSDPHRYLRVDELDANGRVVGGYERWAMYIEDEWNNPRYRIYKGDGKGGWIEIKDRSEISDVEKSGGAVTVDANDDTRQMLLAGGISVSSGLGAGAAAAVVVSNKTVEAKAHDMTAYNNVNVTANNHDRLAQLALSVGVSTGTDAGTGGAAVQIGAAIQSLGSKANAISDGDVTSETGAFNLTANNTTSLTNVAAALALSRDIAATPVFAYTGFSGEATANLKSGTVNAQNGVNVAANSNKDISQYTVGVAASGSVALSGALSVMTLKDQTNALVAAPVDVTSNSMNVNADSDYTLRGASGTLAGSIGNAVALNGMVSIVKANTLAEMAGKANVKASGLTVKANSKRDIINAAATVSAAGTGAISAGVMALVVGDKMDQEAADQLTYGSSTNKDKKLFDADAMIDDLAGRGIDTSAMSGMSDDLSGNGATTDTTTLGHTEGGKQTFDVASGYSDGTDGGSKSASETGDVQRAKQIGSTAYTDSPKDAVIARIAETAEITGGVKVTANQTTLSDLYGASVAVGGDLGGGISIALAKLRSNVLASSTGTIHAEDQDVTIEAISDSASAKLDADESARSNALIGTLGDKVKPENRTIRAIGLAVGGSLGVGGAVSAAFVRLDNITDATLAGHVEKAKVIDVNGKANYNNILAATIAAGGGTAGIAGSLAIAVADGTVNARLGKNRTAANAVENDGTFSGSGKVNVKTDSTFAANAIAVSAAGGVVGVAGGLGLATNNLTQNTAVERGVKLTNTSGSGALNVEGKSTSTANSYLMGLSVGTGAVGLGVSIAKVKPTLNTTVGADGATSGTTDLTGIKTVDIKNDVTSKSESKLMSAAIGGVTVGVNVMTVFNDTNATAKAANLTGTVDDLKISGLLGAKGVSDVTTFSGSGLGLGVTVNYVDVNSKNNAEADLTNGSLIINKKLSVTTGDAAYSRETSATANSTTAEVGEGTIGVNTAITRNRAANVATITGKDVNAANVELKSYSKGTSDAKLTGISIGGVDIATSVVNARNEATSIAGMNLSGALNGDLDALSDVQGTTDARLFTGGGALLGSVKTNVATTHGATNALLDVSIGKASDDWRTISAKVSGKDTVNTEIDNLSAFNGAISAAAMVGGAHSKDVYDNKVRLGGSGTYKLHRIDVITGYEADTDSKVTPSKGGVDVSVVGVNMNEAFATGKVYAGSNLTVQDAKLVTDAVAKERANVGMSTNQNVIDDSKNADVNVLTVGTANVDAAIRPATFTMSVLGVAASKAVAEQKSTQAATLQLGNGGIEKAGNVYVQSVVTKGETNAAIGTSGTSKKDAKDKRVKLGTVSVDVNSAKATGSIASTASILGGATSYDTKMDWVDEGHYETEHKVYTDYNSVERYAWRDKKTGKTTDSDLEMVKQICKDSNIKWKDEWDQDPQDIINTILYGGVQAKTKEGFPIVSNRYVRDVPIYEVVEEDVDVWVPKMVYKEVQVPVFDGDVSKNILNAGNLYVQSEDKVATGATARSDGAYTLGLVTGGNLKAEAFTGDQYNVVFDKVKANIAGEAVLMSKASATADAIGAMPGSLSVADGSSSRIKAGVGTEANKQMSKVLVGEDSELTAGGALKLHALNNGEAEAAFRQGTSISLAKKASSSQPVDSWYDTGVVIGDGAKLNGGNNTTKTYTIPAIGLIPAMTYTETIYGLDILTKTTTDSKSQVNAKNIGLLLNLNKMKGEVTVHSDNNVTIGDKADLSAKGDVNIFATDVTEARATNDLDGGGLFDGSVANAEANITRNAIITVGKGARITSENGGLFIQSRSGQGDDIQVIAKVTAGGAISIAKARTDATVTSNNAINVLEGAELKSRELVRLYAIAGSSGGEKNGAGIYVYPKVKSYGVGIAPESKAVLTTNFTTNININRSGTERTKVTSERGRVRLYANNESMFIFSDPGSDGKSCGGSSTSKTDVIANLKNLIWIDAADISAFTDVEVRANNGNGSPARIKVATTAELYSAGGKVRAENWIKGALNNQIRTNNKNKVTFTAARGSVTHLASVNLDSSDIDYTRKRALPTTSKKGGNNWEWTKYWRCDFCGTSGGGSSYEAIQTIGGSDASSALDSAMQKALAPISTIAAMAQQVSKGLMPLTYMNAVTKDQGIMRARFLDEEAESMCDRFVLAVQSLLSRDVRIDSLKLADYRVWTNDRTADDVYVLPNSTRLYINGDVPQYIAETLVGDLRGDGVSHNIAVVTALTEYAYAHPIMAIGSSGALDMTTGILTIPSYVDHEMLLNEVSASGMLEQFESAFLQVYAADPAGATATALNGENLPSGTILRGIIPDGELSGWLLYWLGQTPETVQDPDQVLYYLLVNPATDEIDAFRTSANMIASNAAPVDISIYLFRDSKSDRAENERYNVLFFDTPEGEESEIRIVTDVLGDRTLEMPRPLRLPLRKTTLAGAELPMYSLSGSYIIMLNGMNGEASLFDGQYHNTFDGDTFESDYVVIEGLASGDVNITLKQDQPVWPEWTGTDSAVTVSGESFIRVNGQWTAESPVAPAPTPYGAKAA